MNVLCSLENGLLLVPSQGGELSVHHLIDRPAWDQTESRLLISQVDDWATLSGATLSDIIANASRIYWVSRAVGVCEDLLSGLPKELEDDLFGELEDLLKSRASVDATLNHLLIAPLSNPEKAKELAVKGLSCGYAAAASLCETLRDLQPLLRRLVAQWFELPELAFERLSKTKQEVWRWFAREEVLLPLVRSSVDVSEFRSMGTTLLFRVQGGGAARTGFNNIWLSLTHALFPQAKTQLPVPKVLASQEGDSEDVEGLESTGRFGSKMGGRSAREHYDSVLKQINAIIASISQGYDTQAKRYIGELIDYQLAIPDGEEYLVKSLCNIAKQSADLFRTDFEAICLERALEVMPDDGWMLIQLGDHYKRTGQYDKAVEVLREAASRGQERIALSSLADVFSTRGEFELAIQRYREIKGWENDDTILTGIADNYRRLGRFDEAELLYDRVIAGHGSVQRARAGLAVLRRQQGYTDSARKIYRELIEETAGNDEPAWIVYCLSMSRILKQRGEFSEALAVVDGVIERAPFAAQARVVKASLLGLLDQANRGLNELPSMHRAGALGEWTTHFYRGLLYLKLDRFEEARSCLLDRLHESVTAREDAAILRLAAAFVFLYEERSDEAAKVLKDMPLISDAYISYLRDVFELHLATLQQDAVRVQSLVAQIGERPVHIKPLSDVVRKLRAGDTESAKAAEIEALLKMAAA